MGSRTPGEGGFKSEIGVYPNDAEKLREELSRDVS